MHKFLPLTMITLILLYGSGCATHRAGTIRVSHPRVWEDHAIVTTIGQQYKKIEDFGEAENQNIRNFQGRRARRYYQVHGIKGAFKMQFPSGATLEGKGESQNNEKSVVAKENESGGNTSDNTEGMEQLPNLPGYQSESFLPGSQSPGLMLTKTKEDGGVTLTDIWDDKISEDPIDVMQRVDDFNQILSGMKLTHLRDSLSMLDGWSVYLLGFDISLLPGDKTQEGHSAQVEFTLKNKNVRVYGVWPKQYADRFQEVSSIREDFRLALQGAAQGQQWAAQMSQDLAQRYEEDLALIQRYPLISGFIDGKGKFGWEFNPRIRIVTKDRFLLTDKQEHVYWLEPGIRQCYAIIAIKDDRKNKTENALLNLDIDVIRKWFNRDSGKYVSLENDLTSPSPNTTPKTNNMSLNVELPYRLDMKLAEHDPVWPVRGLTNQDTIVTILGENFSYDSEVFVGGVKAENVKVLGRDYISAIFPRISTDLLEGKSEKKFTVKVISNGDARIKKEAFTYVAPPKKPEPKKPDPFVVKKINPLNAPHNSIITIDANRPVMDKVTKVWFGELGVHPNNMASSEDKKVLNVIVPYDAKNKKPATNTAVFIKLVFDPKEKIISNNFYKFPTPFIYQ